MNWFDHIAGKKTRKQKRFPKTKLYHASPRRMKPGTIIVPGSQTSLKSHYEADRVYMTPTVRPHFTILERALKDNWYIYEVQPLADVEPGWYDDFVTTRAEIVRQVGTARGLSRARQNKKQPPPEDPEQRPESEWKSDKPSKHHPHSKQNQVKPVKPKGVKYKPQMGQFRDFEEGEFFKKRRVEEEKMRREMENYYKIHPELSLEKARHKFFEEHPEYRKYDPRRSYDPYRRTWDLT